MQPGFEIIIKLLTPKPSHVHCLILNGHWARFHLLWDYRQDPYNTKEHTKFYKILKSGAIGPLLNETI